MRTIIIVTVVLVLLYSLTVTALDVAAINLDGSQSNYKVLAQNLREMGAQGWFFVKPILQLVIILLVFEWFGNKLGFNIRLNEMKFGGNIQVLIAALIIVSFCLAVLAGIPVGDLKEIALIVVGFYFGSREISKSRETKDEADKSSEEKA